METVSKYSIIDWQMVDHEKLITDIIKRLRADKTMLRLTAVLLHIEGLPRKPNA